MWRWNKGAWLPYEVLEDASLAVTEFDDTDDLDDPGRTVLRRVSPWPYDGGTWWIERRNGGYALEWRTDDGATGTMPMHAVLAVERVSHAHHDLSDAAAVAKARKPAIAITELAAAVRRSLGASRVLHRHQPE